MKIFGYFAIVIVMTVGMFLSCASSPPMRQENVDFQNTANVNMTFIMRGIYSKQAEYKDTVYTQFYQKLRNNQIVFKIDTTQKQFVVFSNNGEEINITINSAFKYERYASSAFLTSIVNVVGLLEAGTMGNKDIENIFYTVISDYANYGVDVSAIVGEAWFKNREYKILSNGIGK
jgi:hypothetical protein